MYQEYKAQFAQRNELHTTAMEQAAADRVLFLNETPKQPRWVNVRFPEYVMPLVLFFARIKRIQAMSGSNNAIRIQAYFTNTETPQTIRYWLALERTCRSGEHQH
jgi:hypothetical protein